MWIKGVKYNIHNNDTWDGTELNWDQIDFENFKENVAILIPKEFVVVDADSEESANKIDKIIKHLNLKCWILQTTKGKHYWFRKPLKSEIKLSSTIQAPLLCGIPNCDIKTGKDNQKVDIVKNGQVRKWIIAPKNREFPDSLELSYLPLCFFGSKYIKDLTKVGEGERHTALFDLRVMLKKLGLSNDNIIECVTLSGLYVLSDAADQKTLDSALNGLQDEIAEVGTFRDKGKKLDIEKFTIHALTQINAVVKDKCIYVFNGKCYTRDIAHLEGVMLSLLKGIDVISELQRITRLIEILPYRPDCPFPSYETLIQQNNRYINLKNGTFDIEEFKLVSEIPDPSYFIEHYVAIEFKQDALKRGEYLESFLKSLWNDDDCRWNSMAYCGYAMMCPNSHRAKRGYYGWGLMDPSREDSSRANNGKSTFGAVIQHCFNAYDESNCVGFNLAAINPNGFGVVDVVDKMVGIEDDLKVSKLDDDTFYGFKKWVSDGVSQSVKIKYRVRSLHTNLSCKPLCFCNYPVNTPQTGDEWMERLLIVPFQNKFSPNSGLDIPKLWIPECRERFLYECLKDARELKQRNFMFKMDGEVMKNTANLWRRIIDSTYQWLTQSGIRIENLTAKSILDIYRGDYTDWVTNIGGKRFPVPYQTFKNTFIEFFRGKYDFYIDGLGVERFRKIDNA